MVFPGSGIWPKYSAGFGKTLTGYGIWLLPLGSGIRQNLSMDEVETKVIFGIVMKEVGMRDFSWKGSGNAGSEPPLFKPYIGKITVLEAFAIPLPFILGPVYIKVRDPR